MGAAFLATILSSVAGFGGATMLLPVFVALFGARDAVAVLTVTQLVSNGSRAWFNREQVVRPIVGWFALGAVPAAIAGSLVFASTPLSALSRVIGAVLLLLVGWRHVRPQGLKPGLREFAAVGAVSGFGSALVGSRGPLTAPFFLGFGLTKRAYIGTEASSATVRHVTKLVVYGGAAVLSAGSLATGLALAPATMGGAWAGARLLNRVPARLFMVLVEISLVVAGVLLLLGV
ncbi:MAG: sulfite exporter TauE/SafE family protein [Thermomicrobiales bacterium]|nr:sulfite exporter TauE/SafE family protein [Thermomicrobiales bacterium]